MILENFQLSGHQRARCWIDELPPIPRLTAPARVVQVEGSPLVAAGARLAAIEWMVPRGFTMYGLLGGEMRPSEEGLVLEIVSTSKLLGVFGDSMASTMSEEARCGLLEEYADAVERGMRAAAKERQSLPGATLRCDIAACGMVGSSELIFHALGKALFSILAMEQEPTIKSVGSLLVIE